MTVSLDDITAASRRIAGHIRTTPLLTSDILNRELGANVWFKTENLQHTGSFKLRGALNAVTMSCERMPDRPVVAYSSGNHAQGVAAAARIRGVDAHIVMPRDAPDIKRANTRRHGARIVDYDRMSEDRTAIAKALAEKLDAELIPPFDDERIMAGQGTVGLEILLTCDELDIAPDMLVAPCSGGGLIGGIATAFAARRPRTRLYACEPAGFDDHVRSLKAGKRVVNDPTRPTICDALMVEQPGEKTFAVNRQYLAGAVAVDDRWVKRAVAMIVDDLKLVVEPSGAIGLAALLAEALDFKGKTVVVVLSGGNIDRQMLAGLLAGQE
jgi:threonine dehydratase